MVSSNQEIGFIGTGHLAQAIIKGLIDSSIVPPEKIIGSNRSPGKLQKVVDLYGIRSAPNNEKLVEEAQVVFVAVKPQDLAEALEPISSLFDKSHIVVSLAAGISLKQLKRYFPNGSAVVRVMTNTPILIRRSVIGYCVSEGAEYSRNIIERLLTPLGYLVPVEEGDLFEALTVACSSGTGFVFELMQYWIEWLEEHGFNESVARKMTVETFLGAALLADGESQTTIIELQKRIVSKKGVTAAGLDSLRELEVERALRISFEKAALRDRELGSGRSETSFR